MESGISVKMVEFAGFMSRITVEININIIERLIVLYDYREE